MNLFFIGLIIFAMSVVIIELTRYAYKNMRSPNRAKINKRLRKYTRMEGNDGSSDILRKRVLSDIPMFNEILLGIPGIQPLDRLVQQANGRYPLGFYLLLSSFLAPMGILCGTVFLKNRALSLIIAAALTYLPFLQLKQLKQKRIESFRKQLPDGLDLISRALKSGHAFTGGMQLVADEFGDPLGPEFEETLDEINFGISVPDALKNLAKRIDCPEIKYFVVAVILQRESGGNLSEVIESLAHIIRENFKFQGKVRVLSAEGRASAVILLLLPFCILGWIQFSSPGFLIPLFSEPVGRFMLGCAAAMMVIGALIISRMVKIEV